MKCVKMVLGMYLFTPAASSASVITGFTHVLTGVYKEKNYIPPIVTDVGRQLGVWVVVHGLCRERELRY